MKRQKRKATPKRKHGTGASAQSAQSAKPRSRSLNRRDLLQNIGYGAIGLGLIGGGGWYFVSSVQAGIAEQDLSRLGNGIPTVVQIHDPQCPRCRALQSEARAAIAKMDDGTIQFLVANIRQPKGRRLAAAHGVGHVTLLLFDGQGRRHGVLVGENSSETLLPEFQRLIRNAGAG